MKLSKLILCCTLLVGSVSNCSPDCVDFWTSQHVGVCTHGIEEIDRELIESALDFFIVTLPQITTRDLSERDIRWAIRGLVAEFTEDPIMRNGMDYAGLQSGKWLIVAWYSDIQTIAFFHELMHVVDEFIYGVIDYKHEDLEWWNCVRILRETYPKEE